ncbi:hypothetical protein [Salinivibrio phage CW02]|uniref:Uncharacterized protein n=1 Tax=Salinivibrio phage CW02 TaxID=1161935 RepID=H9D1G3_9CAUD|nr:hypothetical protein F490_gp32 [Salinivibrio phage CW02]AFE86205.1 hypothetical protein [Salinivibrio phage CW02]
MAGMFDTSIQTQAASQQATQGVQEADALSALAPAAIDMVKTGVEAKGIWDAEKAAQGLEEEFKAVDEEVSGLDKTFKGIKNALQTGGKRRNLELRAKTALAKAQADNPLIADRAEALYMEYFGGAGSTTSSSATGDFQLTAQEEAAQAAEKEIVNLQMAGYSEEQAVGIYQMNKQAEVAETQLNMLQSQAKVNLYQARPAVDATLTNWDVQFNVSVQNAMQEGGGSLPQQDIVNLGRSVDAKAVQMKQKIRMSLTDPDTGSYSVPPSEVDALMQEVDDRAAAQKAILTDNSYQQFIVDRNTIKSNEAAVVAMEKAPQMMLMRKMLPDQAVAQIINYQARGNTKALNMLYAQNPEIKKLMELDPTSSPRFAVQGAAKLFGSVEGIQPDPLSTTESVIVSDLVASNAALATQILEKGSNLAQLTEQNPDALVATFNQQTKGARKSKAKAMRENIQDLQAGAITKFNTIFRNEFGEFPSGIELVVEERKGALTSQERPYVNRADPKVRRPRIQVRSVEGLPLSQEMANVVANLYRSVEANPEALPDSLKGIDPAEAVAIMINSGMDMDKIPAPAIVEPQKEQGYSYRTPKPPEAPGSAGIDMTTGEAERRVEASQSNSQSTSPKSGASGRLPSEDVMRVVGKLKEKGYSLEQALDAFEAMSEASGFTGNYDEKIKASIVDAWDGIGS